MRYGCLFRVFIPSPIGCHIVPETNIPLSSIKVTTNPNSSEAHTIKIEEKTTVIIDRSTDTMTIIITNVIQVNTYLLNHFSVIV